MFGNTIPTMIFTLGGASIDKTPPRRLTSSMALPEPPIHPNAVSVVETAVPMPNTAYTPYWSSNSSGIKPFGLLWLINEAYCLSTTPNWLLTK
ncbi:hypothetical protein D3C75_1219240 [compost metagenome]